MAGGLITNTLITESFFRSYANELLHRADTAGLIKHSATSGSVKEFLCRAVFQRTLPAACALASGQVFDPRGIISRQCDIIIFDDRIPKLEVATGIGMYPIEGVIATVEVKSQLDKTGLEAAFENAFALHQLEPVHCGTVQVSTGEGTRHPATEEEKRLATAQIVANCYVFSFDSCRKETAAEHIKNWYTNKGCPTYPSGLAMLPRCIVGKNWIGLLDDGYITISSHSIRREGKKNSMVLFEVEEPLTLFLPHLLHKISLRIRAQIGTTDGYFSFNHLLPTGRLLDELLSAGNAIYISWD